MGKHKRDGNYRPGDENKKRKLSAEELEKLQQQAAHMGMDPATHFIDDQNQQVKIHTYCIIYPELLGDIKLSDKQLLEKLNHYFQKIDSHLICTEILALNKNGSPIKLKLTTSDAKVVIVERHFSHGFANFFDNRHSALETNVITKVEAKETFLKSDIYSDIHKLKNEEKSQELFITLETFKKIKAEKDKRVSKRVCSQNSLMNGSVNEYVIATKSFASIPWEWLHLIADMVSGDDGMISENLIAGSQAANKHMLLWEKELRTLSNHYPEGFTLRAVTKAVVVTNNETDEFLQIGTYLDYHIVTPDFMLPLKINLQTTEIPLSLYGKYTHSTVKSLTETFAELKLEQENKKTIPDECDEELEALQNELDEVFLEEINSPDNLASKKTISKDAIDAKQNVFKNITNTSDISSYDPFVLFRKKPTTHNVSKTSQLDAENMCPIHFSKNV